MGKRKSGFTIVELLVVISVIILLAALGVPAIRALHNSLGSTPDNVKGMINAAMASARAIAAKERRCVGIRFQYPTGSNDSQYMIFIIRTASDSNDFKAMEGVTPIKIPSNIAVWDNNDVMVHGTKFSVLFSSSGKLVIHAVRMTNFESFEPDLVDETFSKRRFVIYDKNNPPNVLEYVYINSYVGTIIGSN